MSLVEQLLARMTLEEKVGQLVYVNAARDRHEEMVRQGRVGTVANLFAREAVDALQRIAVKESRLGIPLFVGHDVIHGYRTIGPICLGEACSWDMDLIERTARSAAEEALESGTNWVYGPMVDIARDPRWGRICEGAGEDAYLGAQVAAARVRGLSGGAAAGRVASCVKHYIGYGGCEGGRDYNTVDMSDRVLREVYLPPFRAALRAGAHTVMTAFNAIDGQPVANSGRLLRALLREELGFTGPVITDYNGVAELLTHGVAANGRDACLKAFRAGVDMDMQSGLYSEHLASLVREGAVSETDLDLSVRRVLELKERLGLFEDPYGSPASREPKVAEARAELALEAATRSMVLLKNRNGLLPLSGAGRRVAVMGPLADDREHLLGWWRCAGVPEETVSILAGIRERIGGDAVTFAEGCGISDASEAGFDRAVRNARHADVVVCVLGEAREMVGEAHSRSTLGLPGVQGRLLEAVAAAGKPVVLVLVNGRPLAIPRAAGHADAILEAWMPGSQGGRAVARLLFGDSCPSGKLVVSFPRSVGQIPVHYNHMPTGRPAPDTRDPALPSSADLSAEGMPADAQSGSGEWKPDDISAGDTSRYLDLPSSALYPFGYGLSYTTFSYRDAAVSPARIGPTGSTTVSVYVKNTGSVRGRETVQVYCRDMVASVTRPVRQLVGFATVSLEPGEERRVQVAIEATSLGLVDGAGRWVTEPGEFRLWVGPDSARGLELQLFVEENRS